MKKINYSISAINTFMRRDCNVICQSFIDKISRKKSLFRMGGVASFDQLLLSGTNFLITIAIIKSVPKQEYGYYSIAFALMLFVISLQNALVTTPLTVLLPGKKDNQKSKYVWSLCLGQYIGLIPIVIIVTVASLVSLHFGVDGAKIEISLALSFASFGVVFREFYRTYHFAEQQPIKVLRADVLYSASILTLILFFWWLDVISASLVFILIGLCSTYIFIMNRNEVDLKLDLVGVRDSFSENWIYGKWSLLGVIVTHIQRHSYLYFLGAIMGSLAVADISAARLLMMPFVFLETGWAKVCVPHGARMRERGQINSFYKELICVCFVMVGGVLIYIFAIISSKDIITSFLFKGEYSDSFEYVIYWGAIYIVGMIRLNAASGLKVIMKFDSLAKLNLITMVITVSLLPILINNYGLKGALFSKLLGDSLLCILLWYRFTIILFRRVN